MEKEYRDFPLIDDFVKENYEEKIFEQGARVPATSAVTMGMDFDGDKAAERPLLTEEAKIDARRIMKTLVMHYSINGAFKRNPGKSATQTYYTFTREPKPSDHPRKHRNDREFIKYIMNVKDEGPEKGINFDINYLYAMTSSTKTDEKGNLIKPDYSIYDYVDVPYKGQLIKTTIGRLIVNKVVFGYLWEHPDWDYFNDVMYKDTIDDLFGIIRQIILEGRAKNFNLNRMVDVFMEFGARLTTIYNSSLTYNMLNPDENFTKVRNDIMEEDKERIEKEADVEAIDKKSKEIIKIAKEYYKDDDMIEIYESHNKASWDNDWKAMYAAVGAVSDLSSDKPKIISDALVDGVNPDNLAAFANSSFSTAFDRGGQTALAGWKFKEITNGFQSVKGIVGDCGTREGVIINTKNKDELYGRYSIEDGGHRLILIDMNNIDQYIGRDVYVRDPSKCTMKGDNYCSTCIGLMPFQLLDKLKTAKENLDGKPDMIPIGILSTEVASDQLNLWMKSTHRAGAAVYKIEDLNQFLHPTIVDGDTLFYKKYDEIAKRDRIYVKYDTEWRLPQVSVHPEGVEYRVLAHGSTLANKDREHAINLGTYILTTPAEVITPGTKNNPFEKHYVFKYRAGDPIVNDTVTIKSPNTVYDMLNLFLSGQASNLIPFESHKKTLYNTFKTNLSLKSSDTSFSIILSTLARDLKNPKIPARENGFKNGYKFVGCDDLTVMSGSWNALYGSYAVRGINISLMEDRAKQLEEGKVGPIEEAVLRKKNLDTKYS